MKLDWRPQRAFADFFLTDARKIIEHRTIFNPDYIYFVPYGGRGSAKTMTFCDAVVIEGSLRKCRILVTRELQNSIEESVKVEIDEAISNRNLQGFYNSQKTEINARNGSKIFFKGLKNNINSIKSIADVDIVLCEEAEGISKISWDKFLPSIRPKSGRPPIIIVIFNPDSELDDTYSRFITNPPSLSLSKLINWRQNRHFPPHLEMQRQDCLRTRPKRDYDHIWEGVPTGTEGEGIIDLEWVKQARFASVEWEDRTGKTWPKGDIKAAYDPAGQGKDSNALVINDSNRITIIDEWVKSPDLRQASERALATALEVKASEFRFDTCGGLGDGVEVFVDDAVTKYEKENSLVNCIAVKPFDAGSSVVDPDDDIPGTTKTNGEMYANAKAQMHGITAQLLYNTYRFIVLNEKVDPSDMMSIDIEDDELFNKLAKELKTPLWIRSLTNSKKRVEDKATMEKRTGQASPNVGDGIHMTNAPFDTFMADLLNKVVGGN